MGFGPDDNETIPVHDRVSGQLFVDLVSYTYRKTGVKGLDLERLLHLGEIAWQGGNAFVHMREKWKDKEIE